MTDLDRHRTPKDGAAVCGAPALATALDDFFAWYYATYPINATFIGVHDHDHRLPDFSEAAAGDTVRAIETLRARFCSLPREPLTEAEALDRRLAQGFLDVQRWEYGSTHFHLGNPCVYTGEAVFGVLALFLRPFAPLRDRVEAAVMRMFAIPGFLAQAASTVRRAPRAWTERAIRECDGALAFFERGAEILAREAGITHPRFRDAAASAAQAFRRLQGYLRDELLACATDGYACGAEALELLLRRGHWLDMSADDVVALGEEHLALWDARLREGAAALGFASWHEALAALADRHPPADRYYERYTEVWHAVRAEAERHGLVTWPDYPIRYVPQPRWAREAAPSLYFLCYRAPAPFDRMPVVDYLVTPIDPDMPPAEQLRRLRATNDGVITLNHVIHHGALGHHVQNWYAYHRAGSRIGRVAAVDCASRIAMFCGGTMAEGWACYATDLMEEIGFLDPLQQLAQAHSRLRMAARAVVDVRLHRGEWTLERAADTYRDRAGMSPEAARAEAVKNSMFPGAALMYLVGTHLIHALRRDLAQQPGFVLRDFHDRLLSYGSVPVALVADAMRTRAVG
ncbi:MAG: DUF885 domain-containing protein [Armatimonadota bacterium]|nr:DUF885 domain-containing protein [Armatimonadota bacterium]